MANLLVVTGDGPKPFRGFLNIFFIKENREIMDPTEVIPPRVDTISTWTYIHTAEAILRATRVRMLGLLLHFDKQWVMRSLCRFKRLYLARFCIGSLIILWSWLVYRVQMSCYASHCNEEQVHPTFKNIRSEISPTHKMFLSRSECMSNLFPDL